MFKHVCGETNHKFEEFLIESAPDNSISKLRGGNTSDLIDLIDATSKKKYEIRCKYCGKKAE